jgi:hypothetical protein
MKSKLLLSLLALTAMTIAAHAAVTPTSTLVTGDSSVLTLGTEETSLSVVAFQLGSPITLTNGVVFSNGNSGPLPFVSTQNGITTTLSGVAGNTGALSQTAFSDPNLDGVLEASILTSGSFSLSTTGLTVGHTYDLQIFTALPGGTAGTETVTDGLSSGSLAFGGANSGSYSTVDTFTALTGGSESVTIGSSTTGTEYVAAYELRDITDIPEPSTYAMIGLGLLSLFALGKFRKLTA